MASPSYKVVLTKQVFPSVDVERAILRQIGARLVVADGTRDTLVSLVRDADAVLSASMEIGSDVIEQMERCKVIARYGIGYDSIDVEAASAANIVVTNVPDYCVEEVALHTLAMMLAVVRQLHRADTDVRSGRWGIGGLRPIHRFSKMNVGFVGFGRIARLAAEHVRHLGAAVYVHDPFLEEFPDWSHPAGLEDVLRASDILAVHAPLTPQTQGLIGARELGLMPHGSYLVNTSRGPIVQWPALAGALAEGQLRGAALDVFEEEPPDVDALRGVPGLIASPHVAYYSEESLEEAQRKAATQIVKVLQGEDAPYAINRG